MASRIRTADHTLYHVSPKGFWKKFRDAVVVNPDISSGLPKQGVFRYPPPGSRPELYSTPATKASDPADNPYWKRDVRRAYPQLSVVTQSELSALMIDHAQAKAVPPPSAEGEKAGETAVAAEPKPVVDLTEAVASITAATKAYTTSKLPPLPTNVAYNHWEPELSPPAPHDPNGHFPMLLYK